MNVAPTDNALKQRVKIDKAQEVLRRLKAVPCSDCKQDHPYWRMEFDHVRGEKLFAVSEAQHWLFSHSHPEILAERMKQLLDEVAKCDIVCGNCHLDRTFARGQLRRPVGPPRPRFVPFGAKNFKRWPRGKRLAKSAEGRGC